MVVTTTLAVIALASATYGAAKGAKAIADNKNAQKADECARDIIEKAKNDLSRARESSKVAIENLARKKLSLLNKPLNKFVYLFQQVKNINFLASQGIDELSKFKIDQHGFHELKQTTESANSFASGALSGTVAGGAVAFSIYGTAGALASASTGTAIVGLHGVAATNATLAFFGGGSLAAGGLGVAGGTMVLGGIVAGPALAIVGIVMGAKASANLDNALSNLAQAQQTREEISVLVTACDGIKRRSELFTRVLTKLDLILSPMIADFASIIDNEGTDYSQYSEPSKKILAALLATVQAVKAMLDTPILDSATGGLTDESAAIAENIQGKLATQQIKRTHLIPQNLHATSEKCCVANLSASFNPQASLSERDENMDDCSFTTEETGIRGEFLQKCAVLRNIIDDCSDDIGPQILTQIDKLESDIRGWYFKVYLIGHFSCGKSTLLNRWLCNDILPRGLQPETAVSAELFYSAHERMLLYPVRGNKPQELQGVNQENMEYMKKLANEGKLLRTQIFLNNPMLAEYPDICLVDMPGLSSAIPAHEFALNQFIQEEGTGIFCVQAKDGTVLDEGLRFLQKMTNFRCGFFLLITKADEVTEEQCKEIALEVGKVVRSSLGISDEEFQSGIVSKDDIADFPRLLDALCSNRDSYFCCAFAERFNGICAEVAQPLNMLLSRELPTSQLDASLDSIAKFQEELPTFIDDASLDIERAIPSATNRIVEKVKSALRGMKAEIKVQVKSGRDCSDEIASQMKSVVLYQLNNEAQDIYGRVIRKAADKLGQTLSFSIDANEVTADSTQKMKIAYHTGKGAAVGVVGGAVAGAAIGSFIPVVGTAIGAGVGALTGLIGGAFTGSKMADDRQLDSELACHLDQQAENARAVIEDTFHRSTTKFKTDLQIALEEKLERLAEQFAIVKNQKDADVADFEAKKADRISALENINSLMIQQ